METQRNILFYVFLGIFVLIAIISLIGLFRMVKSNDTKHVWKIISILCIQVILAVVGLFKATNFFTSLEPRISVLPPVSLSETNDPSFQTVWNFYTSLQRCDYTNAYSLLAPELIQERRWTLGNFEAGYTNTLAIALLKISLESRESDFSDLYVVYYCDEANSSQIPEIGNPNTLTVNHLTNLIQELDNLKVRVVALGGTPETIDNLTLQQLTSFDVGNKIEWLLLRDSKKDFFGKLGSPLLCKSVVGRLIAVEKNSGNWEIREITPLENVPGY